MFRKRTPYLYLLIPVILMLGFFFWPLLMAFQISMMDYSSDLYAPRFVGLDNYWQLSRSPAFWSALKNTFVFLAGVVPAMVILPIFLALLVNGKIKGISLFRSLLYLPVVISMVVVGIAWRWLYADDGIINWLLSLVHLPRVGWLVDPDIALFAVMLVVVWKGLAYYMMMYLAHLQSISHDLYEAADIDGANLWQRHWHVTIPHLQPTMVMVGIIATIGSLKLFTEIYVMTRGGPVGATKTLVYYIYERAFENLDLGIASAAGIVLMLILLIFSLLEMRLSRAQDTAPAPKEPVTTKPLAPTQTTPPPSPQGQPG